MSKQYKIKLQPGDYCSRSMGEEKYREVARRFFDDGCPRGEEVGGWRGCDFFGWCSGENRFVHRYSFKFDGNHYTYEEIMETVDTSVSTSVSTKVSPQWDGEGFPPIGVEVKVSSSFSDFKGVYFKVIAVDPDFGTVICRSLNGEDEGEYHPFLVEDLVPSLSERKMAIADMFSIMNNSSGILDSVSLGALYDAGYRKVKT